MNWKGMFKSVIPFIIGILIGGGFTQNKNVLWIMIGFVLFMFAFRLLADKIRKVHHSEKKKDALKHEAKETVKDVGEATLKGNQRGANLFDKYYGDYIFYVNIGLFLAMILLAVYSYWMWVLVCFLGLQFHMVLNQNVRMTREIKEKVDKDEHS